MARKPLERPPLAPVDLAQRYTISEATSYLRISHASIYKEINARRLQVIKQGKRTFVPGGEIARLSQLKGQSETHAGSGSRISASPTFEETNAPRLLDSRIHRVLMKDITRQKSCLDLLEKFDCKLQYLVVLVERLIKELPEERRGA
jgi:hypothetical protein